MLGDARELWGQTVSYINQRNTVGHTQIGIYLDYLAPETLSDSELIVSTDNSFAKTWVERYYFRDIKDAIFNIMGFDLGFRIVISDKSSAQKTLYQQMLFDERTNVSSHHDPLYKPKAEQTAPASGFTSQEHPSDAPRPSTSTQYSTPPTPLSYETAPKPPQTPPAQELKTEVAEPIAYKPGVVTDERTFDSFIVGDSNRYAFSTAKGVAKSPGNIYNPLFIYGESGLGKTHLLVAIENYIKIHHPDLKTTYAQTSDFVKDFTSMLYDENKRREFEQRYHNVDVILLDDVQYLEGKIETTGEVFQILNRLTSQNKQIVLSADRPPYSIAIDERYTSRFASGPTIDIQPPGFETKYAIFENYFDYCCSKINRPELKELITPEIIDRIIELSSDNIRELNGATASLVAYLSIRQNRYDTLTIEEVERRVLSVFMRSEAKRIDIGSIQKEIESFYKVSHGDLISKKRSQGISYPRQIAMYLARNLTNESFPDIGKAFGGKDHTSVMYACNKIEQSRQLSKKLDKEIESLIKAIRE